jgi:aryl-alcohol dehydrogenase-like predicted oxidoreductase
MNYRNLGNTGIKVSEIGFGAWTIGGLTPGQTSYGRTDDKVSLEALQTAFDLGINFFDTANIYGNGHSEELIGKAFKKERSKAVIASKCGFKSFESAHDFSDKAIRASIEDSLVRLQTDYLDLLQLHDPPTQIATDEKVITTLIKLRDEGKIRAIGISVKSPLDGLKFLKHPWQTIQCNFNMIDQRAMDCGLMHQAEKTGIGIIARTPLAFGFLSGKFTGKKIRFEKSDHRSRWGEEQLRIWADAPEYFAPLNKNKSRTLSQLAIKFCISFDGIATVIPGIMNKTEAMENASVSDLKPLLKSEIKKIVDTANKHEFFIK